MEPLERFLNLVEKFFGGRVRAVVLFGSRVRGSALPGSDYDLLVVLSEKPETEREFWGKLFRLEVKFGVPFDVVIVEEKELSTDNPLLWGVLTGYKVLRGSEYWEMLLRGLKSKLKQKNPLLIEGDKQWQIAQLI